MTTSKHILKIGRIRENWLEDFPQHISINPKSYYQLLIGNDDLTLEFQLTDSNNLTIDLPLLQGYNYDCIVSWGDDEFSTISSAIDEGKKHTYLTPGTYLVTIIGKCETLNNYEYEIANEGKNAWEYLTSIINWR